MKETDLITGAYTMTETYMMSVDMGTTHIKCAIFDSFGQMTELRMVDTPSTPDEFGTVYVPENIRTEIFGLVYGLLEKYPGIRAIAVTGMSEAGLIFDTKKQKIVTPILPWFDQRTRTLSQSVTKEDDEERFYITGLRNSYKYGIYKFLWLIHHYRQDLSSALWMSVTDYILWELTGTIATVPSFAARTYAYDIYKGCWDEAYLDKYGLSEKNMPPVAMEGTPLGNLRMPKTCGNPSADALISVRLRNIPVYVSGHDHLCAAIALKNLRQPGICNSVGTAETFLGFMDRRPLTRNDYVSGLSFGPAPLPNTFFWMANIPSAGQSVEWLRSKLHTDLTEAMSYEEMNRRIAALPAGPTGILYYPFLSGCGTPLFSGDTTATLTGLKVSHTQDELCKGMIEGLNYFGRYLLSLIPKSCGCPHIYCAGGAAYSPPWMTIKAAITGCTVHIPHIEEVTLTGAAALTLALPARERFLSGVHSRETVIIPETKLSNDYENIFTKQYLPVLHALYQI